MKKKAAIKPRSKPRKAAIKNSNVSNPDQWLIEAWGGMESAAGERVNEKSALGLSAYLACIKNISEDEAKLPLCLYEKLKPRGRQRRDDHPVDRLIHDQPNEEMTAMTFRQTLTCHALGWHGGFAEIVRNGAGVPVELWPLDPCCVQVMREQSGARRLFYWVTPSPSFGQESTPGQVFMPWEIFHVHGLGYNGVTGYILSRIAKDPIGNALASQRFSGAFFSNGATSTGTIEVPDAMTQAAFKNLRDSFAARHQGAINQWKPIILEQGAKWNSTSNDPQKSQMVETLYYGVEDIAKLFRIPLHKIGHLQRSTNNNIEQQAIEYIQDCLMGWLVRWEQEIWRKLLLPREQKTLYAKHNVDMLMRGDSLARSTFYREMFNIGAYSDNDIRELEDMNPVPGGDTYFVNAAMVPLEMAAEGEHLVQTQTDNGGSADQSPENLTYQASFVEHKRELFGRIAVTHNLPLCEEFGKLLRIEYDKATRAIKHDETNELEEQFYKKTHETCVFSRLEAAIFSLSESLDLDCSPVELTKQFAREHVARSLLDLREPKKLATWTDGSRAKEQAEYITTNLMAKACCKLDAKPKRLEAAK